MKILGAMRFFFDAYRLRLNAFEAFCRTTRPLGFSRFRNQKNRQKRSDFRTFAATQPFHMRWYDRLQQKWNVNGLQLALILVTFAVGGSLTGQVGKWAMDALQLGEVWYWGLLYLLIITALWPMMVLLVSLPMGQFRFFLNYINKLAGKLGLRKKQ